MFYMVASTSNPDSRWQPQTTAKPWIPSCQQPSCWDKQSRKIAWWLGGIKDFTNQVLLLVCSKPHTPVTRISWQNIRRLYLEHWSCSPAWLHTGAVKFDSCEAMQGEQHSFLEPVTITCLVWLKYSEKLILYTPWVSQQLIVKRSRIYCLYLFPNIHIARHQLWEQDFPLRWLVKHGWLWSSAQMEDSLRCQFDFINFT